MQHYFLVGSYWDDAIPADQTTRFIENGIWENGYTDKFIEEVKAITVGSRIAIKAVFTREKTKSVMAIKAIGTVLENKNDGKTLIVEWDESFYPFEVDFSGGYWATIKEVTNQEHINAIFYNNSDNDIKFEIVKEKFEPNLFDSYINFLKEIISELNIKPNDQRIVYSVREKSLNFTIGQRYCFNLFLSDKRGKYGIISKSKLIENSEPYAGAAPQPYYTFLQEINLEILNKDSITEAIKDELNRTNKSSFLKYNNEDFENYLFSIELEENSTKRIGSDFWKPLLQVLQTAGKPLHRSEVHKLVVKNLSITQEELNQTKLVNGKPMVIIYNQIDWARETLKQMGLIKKPQKGESGMWGLTEKGMQIAPNIFDFMDTDYLPPSFQKKGNISPYNFEDDSDKPFIPKAQFLQITSLLLRKKNIVLQGSPGVGKTFIARKIAYSIMGETNDNNIEVVQFHQSYSYEDFIQGFRPSDNGFVIKDGLFINFCKKALANPNQKFFLIIDEINRGNLSKIMGELMMLIEADKRNPSFSLKLTYAQSETDLFYVPENIYLIGTMNTADRSLALVDYALRRRFAFITLLPEYGDAFKSFLIEKGLSEILTNHIATSVDKVNDLISKDNNLGEGFLIGHSYFCNYDKAQDETVWWKEVIDFELKPLLEEIWFDEIKNTEKALSHLELL